ncbi:hypothetical protein WNY78_17455 [Psychroserpens sp. AS72]|uniref:hypothetical protein n=1 Tax=Psychroserpens sp. AS72 TaxID=3135775 RepID=UPI0031766FE3
MLTISPSLSYSSIIVYYINMIRDFTLRKLDFVMVAKSAVKDIQVMSPIIISSSLAKNKKDENEQDSNLEHFQWKLKKNLETLKFLTELELRYDKNKSKLKFIDDCNAIKIEVQQNTIELTRKIAFYKT